MTASEIRIADNRRLDRVREKEWLSRTRRVSQKELRSSDRLNHVKSSTDSGANNSGFAFTPTTYGSAASESHDPMGVAVPGATFCISVAHCDPGSIRSSDAVGLAASVR